MDPVGSLTRDLVASPYDFGVATSNEMETQHVATKISKYASFALSIAAKYLNSGR